MPHFILEHSSNVIEKNDFQSLFSTCHDIIAEILPVNIESCKSRSTECKTYRVGSGQTNSAFVHVNLKVMSGRPAETLAILGDKIMQTLKTYFSQSLQQLNLQITLEVNELPKTFLKVAS